MKIHNSLLILRLIWSQFTCKFHLWLYYSFSIFNLYKNINLYIYIYIYVDSSQSAHYNNSSYVLKNWNWFWVHITDHIICHLKLNIHVITTRRRTDKSQQLFHQRNLSFVIRIIYKLSRNTYCMINITNFVQ